MPNAIELLTTLFYEAEEAALRLDDGKHADTTLEYWKGRRDSLTYAIRELRAATGDGESQSALELLGSQLERDFSRRTIDSDLEQDR